MSDGELAERLDMTEEAVRAQREQWEKEGVILGYQAVVNEEYEHDRSFYFDYKSFVPGRIVINNDEIIEAVKAGDFRVDRIPAFREKFMGACDGECVKRIAEYAIM